MQGSRYLHLGSTENVQQKFCFISPFLLNKNAKSLNCADLRTLTRPLKIVWDDI